MPQTFVITGRVEFSGDANLLLGGRVEAYDRDLPSLEQRGKAPKLLGQSLIAEITDSSIRILGFRIEFTDEQFRQDEATTVYQPLVIQGSGRTLGPDLSFSVFDATGRELRITGVVIQDRTYLINQIIFNVPPNLEGVTIQVRPFQEESDLSEYQGLLNLIAPVIADIPLVDLTEDDVLFLLNELGFEIIPFEEPDSATLEAQNKIQWLRRSALLAQQTNLPTEAFYGWGRLNIPYSFEELAVTPLSELFSESTRSVLNRLIARSNAELRQELIDANDDGIISISSIDEIVYLLKRYDQVLRTIGIQLIDAETEQTLIGYTVITYDATDATTDEVNLGLDITDNNGKFLVSYYVPRDLSQETSVRQFLFQITTPEGTELPENVSAEISPNHPEADVVLVRITVPKSQAPSLETLQQQGQTDIPEELFSHLVNQENIKTFADIRHRGGVSQLTNLPQVDSTAIQKLDALADLDRISPNIQVNTGLLNKYDSVLAIADTPVSEFVDYASNGNIGLTKLDATMLHANARAQTDVLDNMRVSMATNQANGTNIAAGKGNLAEKLFPQPCGCSDCEAAVSPAAYLAALLDYTLKHVRNNSNKIEIPFLEENFHQPFGQLPTDCEAVEKQVRQVRLCVEVLRSYLGDRPVADPAKEAALKKAEEDYCFTTYSLLLNKLGITYEEIRRVRNETPENRQALAERLGIDLAVPRFADPLGDALDQLFLNPQGSEPNVQSLTEQALEKLFGIADTTRDPLSENAKLGDDLAQLKRWNLNGAQWGDNTDRNGIVHVSLTKDPVTNAVQIRLYQDKSRQKLVAVGEIATDSGTVKLIPENDSRLSGVIDVVYTTNSEAISIVAIPNVLIWRLQHLRTLWEKQDWPDDPYREGQSQAKLIALPTNLVFPTDIPIAYANQVLTFEGAMQIGERETLLNLSTDADKEYRNAIKKLYRDSQRLPIIDPDIISPDDFRSPRPKNSGEPDKAFDLWLARREEIDTILRNLQTARESQDELEAPETSGLTVILQQVLGSPLPDLDDLLMRLTQGGSPEDINAAKVQIADLNLTVESFSRLMVIREKDQLAHADNRNEKVSDEEWQEAYSILTQAQKVGKFAEWRIEEQRIEEQEVSVQLGMEDFWLSLREPKEGDWPPVSEPNQPLIDPDLVKLIDLPEWKTNKEAIDIWNKRIARLEQIPKELKAAREANANPKLGFDAMLRLALGHPESGNELQYDLNELKDKLNNSDENIRKEAIGQIKNDLHLTVENFNRLMEIKAKNDQADEAKKPTAAEWAEVYKILTSARKVKHEYRSWQNEEQTANLVYWKALKAKLPRWRTTLETRQTWQQALQNRSQNPIIDPDAIGSDDLKHLIASDPAYDLWKKRHGTLADYKQNLRDTREAEANELAGLDKIIKDALGIEATDLEEIDQERQAGQSIEKRLEQLNLTNGSFTYLLRIRGLAKTDQHITESEWDTLYATLTQVHKQRLFADWREKESKNILLSPDLFKIPQSLTTPLPGLNSAAPLWLSTWQTRRNWQDALQSRIDQANSTIEALRNAISTVEEATLPALRDALIRASDAIGETLSEQAEWITDLLLIDAKAGGCQITTRVAQALETLQLLFFRLRSGQIRERRDWNLLQNAPLVRPGSFPYSAPLTFSGGSEHVLAVVGDDNRVYSTFASIMFDGPWSHVGSEANHTIPDNTIPTLFAFENNRKAYLFATGNDGLIYFTLSDAGNSWQIWSPIGNLQIRTDARITVAGAVREELVHIFVVRDNGQIYGNWWDGEWHDWTRIGSEEFIIPTNAALGAASLEEEVHLFVAGNDGKIYTSHVVRNIADDWTVVDAAGMVTFSPGVAVAAIGTTTGDAFVELVAVATDGGIYHSSWNEMFGEWTAWVREGTLAVPVNANIILTGSFTDLELFVVGENGGVYWKTSQDWKQIGDTTVEPGAPIAIRVDPAGARHLYVAKGNKVFTTSQVAVGTSWNLAVQALTLSEETPQFDEEWKWIGSYATWRAAMFVFLYPENILQPSLLNYKTPAFDKLIKNTRATQLDPQKACQEAEKYANYFRDICSLEIEATCQASTVMYTGEGCDRQLSNTQSMFYMFGRAPSGKIYWSAYNADAKSSGYEQTHWKEIPGFGNTKVLRIIGATPYRKSSLSFGRNLRQEGIVSNITYKVLSSYIYLFCITVNEDKQTLKLARLNLDNFGTWETIVDLSNPPISLSSSDIIPVQTQGELNRPGLVFHQNNHYKLYYRQLNIDGVEWEQNSIDWSSYFFLFRDAYAPPNIRAALKVNSDMLWLVTSDYKERYFDLELLGLNAVDQPPTPARGWRFNIANPEFLGILPGPEVKQINQLISSGVVKSTVYIFWRDSSGVHYQRFTNLFGDEANNPIHDTLVDLIQIPPQSGTSSTGQKMFAYQRSKEDVQPFYMYKYTEADDKLIGSVTFRAVPRVQEPLDISHNLSASQLEQRRKGITKAFTKLNADATPSVLSYLREAYYFVPLHLALSLQTAGHYLVALDWFRTIYDYEAKLGERNIYHGLDIDAALPEVSLYQQTDNWLLDPLNPHLIAATRRYAYTRFTLASLVRCLLDFADAEFTQETGESLARARTLYLKALELLNLPELQQKLGACDDLIGKLKVEPGKDIPPEVPALIGEIREELTKASIADFQVVTQIVDGILDLVVSDAPWETRLVEAKAIYKEAVVNAPLPPSTGAAVVMKPSGLKQQYAALLTQPAIDFAVQGVGKTAAAQLLDGMAQPREINQVDNGNVSQALPQPRSPVITPSLQFCIPPNPILKTLRMRGEVNLNKLRSCRNIAGIKRELELYAAATDTTTGLPTIGAGGQLLLPGLVRLQPTLYRYQVLIERAKQLVQLAVQIEAAFLAALIKRDDEAYTLLKARQELNLTQASVQLQNLRITEAKDGVTLAELQQIRAQIQFNHYTDLLSNKEIQQSEQNALDLMQSAARRLDSATSMGVVSGLFGLPLAAASGVAQGAATGVPGAALIGGIFSGVQAALNIGVAFQQTQSQADQIRASINSTMASIEIRRKEWELQQSLANQDIAIGDAQIMIADDRVEIVTQEKVIEELKTSNAKDAIEFLTNKFTDNELFDWMSDILEEVYRFFLQQATSIAKLAENQLAFERQEVPPTYIQSDYWNVPSENAVSSTPNTPTPDRKGLTGSARLLQDIYQLDQYAFNTNKRKLQLSKTFSLALLAPAEFQRFRETGVLLFSTPMELFDRDFPGHYLRLIRRVRTSVIALIPPIQGIKATLSTVGITRVVVGPDVFQTIPIRRDPEFVALTSPTNATGLFELESLQPDFLLPFEGNGVDSSWEFRMPKAANQFDYRTIADVLITIEYTALNSNDYRQQVIQILNPNLSSDRPFSFRNQFADQWYDLNNPEQTKTPMKVKFQTFREDFPPNVETLKIQQVLLYFVRASEKTFEIPTTELRFTERVNQGTVGGIATAIDGIISTRRGNAGSWTAMIGKSPVGEWELTLPNTEEVKKHFQDEEIDDILFVITYAGRTPEWPA
ncbi:hypothetical protein H6G64_10245 [Calothrix sp. FACHB-156]|nr:hypothetical protein [Calothrix sp. FACHB-156]